MRTGHRLSSSGHVGFANFDKFARPNPSYRRYARSSVRNDLCRHDAPAEVWRFPISYPRSMFANSYPEFRMLRRETGTTIGDWLFEDILCRWGVVLTEIVSDNGPPFIQGIRLFGEEVQHSIHIRISGYNSRANGLV